MPGKCPSGIKEWLTRVSSIVMLECLQLKVLWNKCVKCLICKRQEMFNSGRRKVMIGKLFQFLASSSSASFFLLHLEPTQRKTISNQEDTPAWAAPIGSDWASHIHIASPTLSSQFSTVTHVIFFKCRFYDLVSLGMTLNGYLCLPQTLLDIACRALYHASLPTLQPNLTPRSSHLPFPSVLSPWSTNCFLCLGCSSLPSSPICSSDLSLLRSISFLKDASSDLPD